MEKEGEERRRGEREGKERGGREGSAEGRRIKLMERTERGEGGKEELYFLFFILYIYIYIFMGKN